MALDPLKKFLAEARARQQIMASAKGPKPVFKPSAQPKEIDRIISIPIRRPFTAEEHEEYCRQHMMAGAFAAGSRLYEPQSNALATYEEFGGLLGIVAVGWGKTLISLGIADRGYKKGLRKILLCVPPEVYGQLVGHDIAWVRRMIPLDVPFHFLRGSKDQRRALVASNKVGCYIMPYSLLSTRDTEFLMENIRPELCIFDEAQALKNRSAARTKRMVRVLEALKPEVVAVSGTITNKSVLDYWHLARFALRERCPLPLIGSMANDWAITIDANAAPTKAQVGPIVPLLHWAMTEFPEEEIPPGVSGFRKAYQLRLKSTPGVVDAGNLDIGTSLTISNRFGSALAKPGPELVRLIDQVNELWQTPDGDDLEHAIHKFKWLSELHAGFYNSLKWPTAEVVANRLGVSLAQASQLLEDAKEHHAALQLYHRELRRWLADESRPNLDTPMLVGQSMANHGARDVGVNLYAAWNDARSLWRAELPERYREPVRVDPFKVNGAVAWAKERKHGIIWVENKEMGVWIYEALVEAGVENALHCPSGPKGNNDIRFNSHGKVAVASIQGHSVGKNLQHHQNQVFVQWPRSAKTAEQALGRLHRNGQEADALVADTMLASEFDRMVFGACLNDACYAHQSTGTRQKLMYVGYDPLPTIYNPTVLRQLGFENRMLSPQQRRLLQDRFGKEVE